MQVAVLALGVVGVAYLLAGAWPIDWSEWRDEWLPLVVPPGIGLVFGTAGGVVAGLLSHVEGTVLPIATLVAVSFVTMFFISFQIIGLAPHDPRFKPGVTLVTVTCLGWTLYVGVAYVCYRALGPGLAS